MSATTPTHGNTAARRFFARSSVVTGHALSLITRTQRMLALTIGVLLNTLAGRPARALAA
jgi:hypothetical protein